MHSEGKNNDFDRSENLSSSHSNKRLERFVDAFKVRKITKIKTKYFKRNSKVKITKPPRPRRVSRKFLLYFFGFIIVVFCTCFFIYQTNLYQTYKLIKSINNENLIIGFQNSAELRPTGGFWGSFAVLKSKNSIQDSSLYFETNPYKMDNLLLKETNVDLPKPMQEIWHDRPQSFVNANWSFDFPDAAKTIEWYFGQGWDTKSDGVFAVSSLAMIDLLKLTGPIITSDKTEINSENFSQTMSQKIDTEYWLKDENKSINEPKIIIKEMAPLLISKVKDLSPIAVFRFAARQMKQGRILAYFNSENQNRIAEKIGISGSVKPYGVDYLSINNANLSGGKSSLMVDQSISYNVNSTEEKTVATVEATRSLKQGWPDVPNINYTRIIAPIGSKIISAFQDSEDILDKVDIKDDNGRSTFGFWNSTDVSQTRATQIKYELPFQNISNGYNLILQKQPGTKNDFIKITINGKVLFDKNLEQSEIKLSN
ncbi:MAG: DUF4012 domain-containing protein [Candidatus Berkelbacteria bacterium]|nr:DUF4012 domain-containing protein [Candidatus Berkelbacteria bacterium]